MKDETVKIFRVNDYEWWAGVDLESVKATYKEHTGIDPDSDEGFDNPREVGDEGMRKLIFIEDVYNEGRHREEKRSFREELDRLISVNQKFPCYFAGTEY